MRLLKLCLKRPELWLLTGLGLVTRLWRLYWPNATVFDEVYFKTYAFKYLTHTYYFDPHPPLVKMIFGFFAWLFRLSPVDIDNHPQVMLRLVPAIAGVMTIIVFYVLLRQLHASRRLATLGASFVLLDNALLVQSRFILMDSLLVLFGISAISALLAGRKRTGPKALAYYVLAGVLAGCAAGTKLTGVAILGLLLIIWLYDFLRHRTWSKKNWRHQWWPQLSRLLILLIAPVALYGTMLWGHFHLLTHSGTEDAFMSVKFQSTLIGSSYYDPSVKMSLWDKAYDLHKAMFWSEESLKNATHPYASKWYTWPYEKRDIFYYTAGDTNHLTDIALLGNPVVWWGTLLIIALAGLRIVTDRRRLKKCLQPATLVPLGFLVIAYSVNWLPFARIQRIMFLYHYFFALLFSIAIAMLLLGVATGWQDQPDTPPWRFKGYHSNWLYALIYVLLLAGFVWVSPLSYGFMLNWDEFKRHTMFSFWR